MEAYEIYKEISSIIQGFEMEDPYRILYEELKAHGLKEEIVAG